MHPVLGWPPLLLCPAYVVCPKLNSSYFLSSLCPSLSFSNNFSHSARNPTWFCRFPFLCPSHQSLAKSCWVFSEWCSLSIIPFLLSSLTQVSLPPIEKISVTPYSLQNKGQTGKLETDPSPSDMNPLVPETLFIVHPLLQSSAFYRLYSREQQNIIHPWPLLGACLQGEKAK